MFILVMQTLELVSFLKDLIKIYLEYPKVNYSNLNFEEYFYKHKELMNIIEYEDLIKII